jgi:hypothetical protein
MDHQEIINSKLDLLGIGDITHYPLSMREEELAYASANKEGRHKLGKEQYNNRPRYMDTGIVRLTVPDPMYFPVAAG